MEQQDSDISDANKDAHSLPDKQAASHKYSGEGVVFSDEQLDAISGLASENIYAQQSKWRTFLELPVKDKWPFFVQYFLAGIAVIVFVLVLAGCFIYGYFSQDPDPKLSIAGINVSDDVTSQLEELESDFAFSCDLDVDLITYDGSYVITESGSSAGVVDSSMKLLAAVSAGDINAIITDVDTFDELSERGIFSNLNDVIDSETVEEFEQLGIVIEVSLNNEEGADTVQGLDLSRSTTWSTDWLPDDLILCFANVTESGTEYPQAFVDYLNFS